MISNKKNIVDCKIGKSTTIYDYVNLYECTVGDNCIIGSFVEIQKGVIIKNNVKVESHSFICTGVFIDDDVFIGHHVVFINDKYPKAVTKRGKLKKEKDWSPKKIIIHKGASIGSNATILSGITIGENAMVGAGSVVTKDVKANETVVGVPAKQI